MLSGEFVGTIADNPDMKIALKTFHRGIRNDHNAITAEEKGCVPVPMLRDITQAEVDANYVSIKEDVIPIVEDVIDHIYTIPESVHLNCTKRIKSYIRLPKFHGMTNGFSEKKAIKKEAVNGMGGVPAGDSFQQDKIRVFLNEIVDHFQFFVIISNKLDLMKMINDYRIVLKWPVLPLPNKING